MFSYGDKVKVSSGFYGGCVGKLEGYQGAESGIRATSTFSVHLHKDRLGKEIFKVVVVGPGDIVKLNDETTHQVACGIHDVRSTAPSAPLVTAELSDDILSIEIGF